MSRFSRILVLASVFALAATAHAQPRGRAMAPPPDGPPAGPLMGGPGMDAASMFLARTGDLKLTDQQVTRLAAVARRASDRRKAMMVSMDSTRARRMAAPAGAAAGPPMPPAEARAMGEKMRDQAHADLRDAIGVLTPDQQATAWEMMAGGARARRMGARGMARMGGGHGMGAGMPGMMPGMQGGMRGGMGGDGAGPRTMNGGQGPRGNPRPAGVPPGTAPGPPR